MDFEPKAGGVRYSDGQEVPDIARAPGDAANGYRIMVQDIRLMELTARSERQMDLSVCSGCDACGLRCAAGVPATQTEWNALKLHVAALGKDEGAYVSRVLAQDKSVDLGDGVSVKMCRYRDMELGRCAVYSARPLVCRLMGHVEWMPCPIEKVPRRIATTDALELMREYSGFDRRIFEEWEEQE